MTIALAIAGAAALIVIAYARIRERAPESATSGLRAVRELAAVVLVCVRAVEGIVDVLARPALATTHPVARGWDDEPDYDEPDYDNPDYDDPRRTSGDRPLHTGRTTQWRSEEVATHRPGGHGAR